MAPKKDTTPPKKKDKYRIRNWRQYNQSLVNRGSITFWFDEESIKKWHSTEKTGKRGRPEVYSDFAVRCGLAIKAVFRVTLRALQGLIESLIKLLGLPIKCPNYSLFSRRVILVKLEAFFCLNEAQVKPNSCSANSNKS